MKIEGFDDVLFRSEILIKSYFRFKITRIWTLEFSRVNLQLGELLGGNICILCRGGIFP